MYNTLPLYMFGYLYKSILDRVYDYVIYRDLLVTIIQIRQFE